MREISPIGMAVKIAGSQSALARLLSCTPQHVQKMCSSGHVPANRVLKIESATGVTRYQLRPDLYQEAPPTLSANLRPISAAGQSTEDAGTLYSAKQATA